MAEALFVLLVSPFIGASLIYLLLLFADALIGAAADFVGD
jgi:hypothetical protein